MSITVTTDASTGTEADVPVLLAVSYLRVRSTTL